MFQPVFIRCTLLILFWASVLSRAQSQEILPAHEVIPEQIPVAPLDENLVLESEGVWLEPPTKGAAASDFAKIGEFVGKIGTKEKDTSSTIAAQVTCIGSGQFAARVYHGGLPGQDGFDPLATVLIGRRNGDTLVLSGGPWAMFVGDDACTIVDSDGRKLATLKRIRRISPTLGVKPPEDALVLFHGRDVSEFASAKMDKAGFLREGAVINTLLQDFDLHLEFMSPYMPARTHQERANSGVYLQGRYECQILDQFAQETVFDGLGAIYRRFPPMVNMSFPPLTWQTYDIRFTAARFAVNGDKIRNARISSWVNGVVVQDDVEVPAPTGKGQPEAPTLLPTTLQNHGDPIRFRNVWVMDRGLRTSKTFPIMK